MLAHGHLRELAGHYLTNTDLRCIDQIYRDYLDQKLSPNDFKSRLWHCHLRERIKRAPVKSGNCWQIDGCHSYFQFRKRLEWHLFRSYTTVRKTTPAAGRNKSLTIW